MLKFSKIAFKNLFRNKRRTLITFSVIIFGSAALLVAGGFIRYMFDGLAENTIRNGLGHMQIFNPEQLRKKEERPLQFGLDQPGRIAGAATSVPGVRGVAARVDFMGLLSNGEKSTIFLGTGIEPEKELSLGYETTIKAGTLLSSKEGKFQVLLATGLANTLNSGPGDTLTIMSTTTDGALNAVDVEVAGIFSTGIAEYDERALRVPLYVAQKLLDSQKVSTLVVGINNTAATDQVWTRLNAKFAAAGYSLEIRRWYEMATFYQQVVSMFSAIFAILGTIIFVLVVLSSSNTMLMTVLERVREIGTLMAFGTTRFKVMGIFITEGLFMGVLGGILGGAAGYILIKVMNGAHLTMPAPPGSTHGFPIRIPVVPEIFGGVFLLMIATMVVASVIPALRASRLRIVDALNHF
jgi:putative ABC transport system permease protein